METKRVARHKHSAQFRAEVHQACGQADASFAAIALRNGLNANVVYRWLREDGPGLDAGAGSQTAVSTRPGAEFIAVQFPAAAVAAASTDIRIEVRRGTSSVTVNWPTPMSTPKSLEKVGTRLCASASNREFLQSRNTYAISLRISYCQQVTSSNLLKQ